MLATASIGAIWTSCSPDFGIKGVLDRFSQIKPKLIFTASGYQYNGKQIDCLEKLHKILADLPNVEKIIDLFNELKVDKVIHTGDITQAKTLDKFSRLNCSLYGVYGNNDLEENGLEEISVKNGFKFQLPPFSLKLDGRNIIILHEPINIEEIISTEPSLDLIIHGHTHRYTNEVTRGVKIFNPGECAGMSKGKNTIGLVDLSNLNIKRIFF